MIRMIFAAAIVFIPTAGFAQNNGWGPLGQPGPAQPKCFIGADGKTICK